MEFNRREFSRVIGVTFGGLALGTMPETLFGAGVSSYRVKKGETLSQIARKHNTSIAELKKLNNLASVHRIRTGQRLKLNDSAAASAEIPRKLRWKIDHKGVQHKRWKKIIVHHSATDNGNAAIFNRNHLRRNMENGLAYHFVIGNGTNGTGDGEIEIGQRWERQIHGGHVRNLALNEVAVGICLVGNFEKRKPSAKQMASVYNLTQFLQRELLFNRPKVFGHKDLEQNLCPGRFFPLTAYRAHFA